MGRQVRLFSSAHVRVGRSKVATVLDFEVRDCYDLLMVELAQPEVSVLLVLAVAPVITAWLSSLISLRNFD